MASVCRLRVFTPARLRTATCATLSGDPANALAQPYAFPLWLVCPERLPAFAPSRPSRATIHFPEMATCVPSPWVGTPQHTSQNWDSVLKAEGWSPEHMVTGFRCKLDNNTSCSV